MNKWKVAFFLLLFVVIGTVGTLVYWALSPASEVRLVSESPAVGGRVLTVEATAEHFESLAKQYLKEPLSKSPIAMEVAINDRVQIFSDIVAFGMTVPISMDFEPIVSEGNIRLKQTAVHVGQLNLPPSTILKLMNDSITFPEWMTVRPNEEEIYVDLASIPIQNGSRIRAKDIDLANDKIQMEVIIPEGVKIP